MPSIDLKRHQAPVRPAKKKENTALPASLTALLNKELRFGSDRLPDKKKEYLYMELSSLIGAGIDFKSAFELVSGDQRKEKDKRLFGQIRSDIINGSAFSAALERSGKFSLYEVFSLQIGEESGKLVEVLKELAAFYKNKIKQRRKIVGALSYPVIVLCTSLGAVFFMMKFVVPMFAEVFKRFGGELPWVTQQILDISSFLEDYSWIFALVVTALAAGLFTVRHTGRFKQLSATLVLKIPVVGELVKKIYLARLCNAMRLLISARLPLLRAILLSRQMITFYPITASLEKVERDIIAGRSLHQSLEAFDFYPKKMIQLVKVGEETNKLDHFFGNISEQFVDEVEYRTAALSSLMEPLIILFLGLIVCIILVAMYLPLFQMSNSFQ